MVVFCVSFSRITWVGMQFVIVAFSGHNHLLFLDLHTYKQKL